MKKILSIMLVSTFSMAMPLLAQAGEGGKQEKPADKTPPKQSGKGKADQSKGKNDKKDDKAWNARDY